MKTYFLHGTGITFLANHSSIFTMITVMHSPIVFRTFAQMTVKTRITLHLVQPNRPSAWSEGNVNCHGSGETQLSTDHHRVGHVPPIVTDCTPLSIVEDFDAARQFISASSQADWSCREEGRSVLEHWALRIDPLAGFINSCSFQIKFSSLSTPTKIEKLTAGSDEKTQRSPAGNRTQDLANSSRTLSPLSYDSLIV